MSTIMQSLHIYLLDHGPESITLYLPPLPTHSHTPILLSFDMSKIQNYMLPVKNSDELYILTAFMWVPHTCLELGGRVLIIK